MADEQPEQQPENVDVSVNDERFRRSVDHGVMDDDLDYKKLFFWTGFIIVMVAVFLVALIELYDYSAYVLNDRREQVAEYTDIQDLNARGEQQLNSFGVVDGEQQVYHIPIDSAIKIMAQDTAR